VINIKVSDEAKRQIDAGDIKTLKKVLEAESVKANDLLVESANPDNFRFYQGAAQALLAVIKLLP